MKKDKSLIKKFDGKNYEFITALGRKSFAQTYARAGRAEGYSVRTTKTKAAGYKDKTIYQMWIRKK